LYLQIAGHADPGVTSHQLCTQSPYFGSDPNVQSLTVLAGRMFTLPNNQADRLRCRYLKRCGGGNPSSLPADKIDVNLILTRADGVIQSDF